MKLKTITKTINKKFDDFLLSIEDEQVRNLVKQNSLISGGCIASMLMREKVNDYDIYFTNKETCLAVARYYANKLKQEDPSLTVTLVDTDEYPKMTEKEVDYCKERGFQQPGRIGILCLGQSFNEEEVSEEEMIEMIDEANKNKPEAEDNKPKYRVEYISPNAISLSHKVQIILRFYGSADEIHSNYDFVHCTNYWSSKDQSVHLNQPALISILTKELRYIGSKYPIASMIRIRKFVQRGWTCNAGVHLKIAFQISKLNMEDVPTLEDQLVGVDVAYFAMFIGAMRSAQKAHAEENKPFAITYNYICEIIDRIFND